MKIFKNKIALTILSVFIAFIIFKSFWMTVAILDNLQLDLPQQYAKKSSDWLLHELGSFNETRSHIAYYTLADRKEPRVVSWVINKIKHDDGNVAMYVQALAHIGDKRAIPVLIDVMKKYQKYGSENDAYSQSFAALAKFKYEPLWPKAKELANSKYAEDLGLAIMALENFEKSEGIPILEQIKKRIEGNDYTRHKNEKNVTYYFPSSYADDAIKHIESLRKSN